MNWKVVECNLVLIIGIVVLASLKTEDCNMLMLRAMVILLLAILFFCMPWLNGKYINTFEEMKIKSKLCEYAKEYLYEKEMKESYNSDEKKECEKKECEKEDSEKEDSEKEDSEKKDCEKGTTELEKEREKLKEKISKIESSNNEQKFYHFLLIKWAKENKAPFTKEKFEDIKKQFEEFRKSSLL